MFQEQSERERESDHISQTFDDDWTERMGRQNNEKFTDEFFWFFFLGWLNGVGVRTVWADLTSPCLSGFSSVVSQNSRVPEHSLQFTSIFD